MMSKSPPARLTSALGLLTLLSVNTHAFSIAPKSSERLTANGILFHNPNPFHKSTPAVTTTSTTTALQVQNDARNDNDDEKLAQTFGGYTAKQRLREEVESPFRKVRLIFFASSAGSALTALYFSSLSTLKAFMGGYSDAPPLEEALTSCGINLGAAIVCGYLAFRDYQAGQSNLERIARGGKLARLNVVPAGERSTRTLADYRRTSRVLICAGGKEYIEEVCGSMNDCENGLAQNLAEVDVLVVPVLLAGGGPSVQDTKSFWIGNGDKEEVSVADEVIGFPFGNADWADYLKSDIETAKKQGFDVLQKGINITVKKNGKILRRATGQPRWADFIGAMEVLDGSKFGMPGDSERYGGP